MKILALDPSLTAAGYATRPDDFGTLRPGKAEGKGIERLVWLRDRVLALAAGADLVVIEGYSYASKGRAIISLGELGGVLRVAFHEAGVPVVEIAPTTRAKYATGRGNASKDEVLAAAIRRLDYPGHDNNEADALWLLRMAADHYGLAGGPEMPRVNRDALGAIPWPQPTPLAA